METKYMTADQALFELREATKQQNLRTKKLAALLEPIEKEFKEMKDLIKKLKAENKEYKAQEKQDTKEDFDEMKKENKYLKRKLTMFELKIAKQGQEIKLLKKRG